MPKKGEIDFTESDILAAIPGTYGIMSDIARKLGCNRKTLQRARKKYPGLDKALKEAECEKKDFFEGQLIQNVKKGDVASVIFANKTVNKDRGYEEKSRVGMEGVFTVKWQGEDKKSGRDNGPI